MKPLTIVAIFCSVLFFSLQSSAEMKKLRSWPSSTPSPSAELKRQYEYDPAAGAVSDKVISVAYTTTYQGNVSKLFKTNYSNGVPVSGTETWASTVLAYHGFTGIMVAKLGNDQYETKVVNYTESGRWPSKSFKILNTYISVTEYAEHKTTSIIECLQNRDFNASGIFPALPGKIYEYKCSSGGSTKMTMTKPEMNGETYETGNPKQSNTIYYSDYFDNILVAKTGLQGYYTNYQIEFIGSDNKPHVISYRDDQVAFP